ncbi:MAG TPA: hypothetical protein VG986_11650 [Pseudolabrys sp.]|nr:hypothetical protein [Pseudolabrys sp.]
MRRFLAIVLASSIGLSAPAFAQSAAPVLIGQNTQAAGVVPPGQDAMAQGQNDDDRKAGGLLFGTGGGVGGVSPLLIAGGLAIAGGVIIYAATRNSNNNPVSP